MEITIESSPGSILLRLAGDLRLWGREDDEQHLVRAIRTVGLQLPEHLVLCLDKVTRIDSCGLGALVRVLIECGRRNTELVVVPPRGVPGEAIRRLRMFEAWPCFADETSALQSVTVSKPAQWAMSA